MTKRKDDEQPLEQHSPASLLERAYTLDNETDMHALYSDWAETYDETMVDGLHYLTLQRTSELLAAHLPDRNAHILDVGAGTGLAGSALNALGYTRIDALDFSPDMLKTASRRGIYTNLIQADLNKPLDIANAQYDALICTGTFTHAHVGAACLDELVRIMKPGGRFACTIHNDVWQPQGFEAQINKLASSATIRILDDQQGKYFKTDAEPQGHYLIWQRV